MRILQLVTRRQRRGAEVFAAQLSDELVRRGHTLTLAGLYSPAVPALVPVSASWVDLDIQATRGLSLRGIRHLVDLIRDYRFDLVQANGSDTLKYASVARRCSRGRWPLVYRNISVASRWLRFPGQRPWGHWLLAQVSHVASVSEECRCDFVRTYGIPSGKASTIPIGTPVQATVDRPAMVSRLCATAALPERAEIIVQAGSLAPEKNHGWFLEVFAGVVVERPSAHLVLLGDGALQSKIEAQTRALGLASRVRMLGSRPDAAELMGGADVLVLPSLVEGIPGVILEAAARRVPCVATAVGGVPEAVVDGETGRLVSPGDTAGFRKAVVELLADGRRRESMGAKARRHVQEHFGLDRVVDRFEELYLRLTGRGP